MQIKIPSWLCLRTLPSRPVLPHYSLWRLWWYSHRTADRAVLVEHGIRSWVRMWVFAWMLMVCGAVALQALKHRWMPQWTSAPVLHALSVAEPGALSGLMRMQLLPLCFVICILILHKINMSK